MLNVSDLEESAPREEERATTSSGVMDEETRELLRLISDDEDGELRSDAHCESSGSINTYEFAVSKNDKLLKDWDQRRLDRAVKHCALQLNRSRLDFEEWQVWRRRFNALSLELNERGLVPPAFRPRMRAPAQNRRIRADNLHSIDLQVIDLHWLKCRGWRSTVSRSVAAPIFSNVKFPVERAEEFASLNWRMKQKIAAIRLPRRNQWDMAVLREPEVAKLLRKWRREAERLEGEILWAADRRPELNRCADQWPQLWLARQIAGARDGITVTDDSAVSATEIANVLKMMTRKVKARQTVAIQVARMLKFRRAGR